MFFPNTTCQLYRRSSTMDNFGRYGFAPAVTAPCTRLRDQMKVMVSSPRADQSATRGTAEQLEGQVTFMFPAANPPNLGDVITFDGDWLEVIDAAVIRDLIGTPAYVDITTKVRQALP